MSTKTLQYPLKNKTIVPKKRKWFLWGLWCFLSFSFYGQSSSHFIHLDKTFNTFYSQTVEDDLGYIWISNTDGLYKYNGYDYFFTSYKQIFGEHFISDRDFFFTKDRHYNLWIATQKGELTKINPYGEYTSFREQLRTFHDSNQITYILPTATNTWFGSKHGTLYTYSHATDTLKKIASIPGAFTPFKKVNSMIFVNPHTILVSTPEDLYLFDTQKKVFTKADTPFPIDKEDIIKLALDKKNRIWISSELHGLFCYNQETRNGFTQFSKTNENIQKTDMFISVFCDSRGVIWAGTDGDGLYRIDPETDTTTILKHNETDKFSISNNSITHINEDSKGNIWLTLKKGKIDVLPYTNNNIQYYNGCVKGTPHKILSILKASDNSLWLGTDGNGINRVFPDKQKVQYNNQQTDTSFFKGKYINCLVEDTNGNIWIATYQNGLWVYDIKKQHFSKIPITSNTGKTTLHILSLLKDTQGRIWVGSKIGMHLYDADKNFLANFDLGVNGLFGDHVIDIKEDNTNTFWISVVRGGIFRFNENQHSIANSDFTHIPFPKDHVDTDCKNFSIHPDNKQNLWITCRSGFLLQYNIAKNVYTSHLTNPRLHDIDIKDIQIQTPDILWISSTNGIHQYHLKKDLITSYYEADGLLVTEYGVQSTYQDTHGIIYFGGENGATSFDPKQMIQKETDAQLYINTIEILNKPAKQILGNQLSTTTENVSDLYLNADQASFSFQFSAIDNVLNPNYHYAYRLKGFDQNWITPKKDRIATYTNIPHGRYTFEVKGGAKKGIWNIPSRKLNIRITPPWWLSTTAYILYTIFASLIIYSISSWLQLKNKLNKEAWQNHKEKELYAVKMNFFTKMSHEIQTPLTLITGPIDDMLERAKSSGNQLLNQRLLMIKNNANRLSRIATELMIVRNKEMGRLKILVAKNDLIQDLKNIAFSFSEQARFKNIDFIQEYPTKALHIWYDKEKIEHVIYNLLSNAFKFTPREGTIKISVSQDITAQQVFIKMTDNGPGIPKEEADDIFKLFYQSEIGKNTKGSGIGLALSKELIALHYGEISVTPLTPKGSCFTVTLSSREDLFSEEQKIKEEVSEHQLLSPSITGAVPVLTTPCSQKAIYTLLIVEDNVEMQIFLKDILSNQYNILLAENGLEGVALAEKHLPDVIISDVMMPVMDGIEFCKTLQKKKTTAHIPIILLTAKNTTKTKLEGLQSGAVEFIKKPFNFHELLLRINNIIETREKILTKYKTDVISRPKDHHVRSKDDIFMDNLLDELNKQIENTNYKLEELSDSLHMSYSVIYRKCHEITGKTLVELQRCLKLKRACTLIIKQGYNISEAAFMVGYKDAKYFTKCFKEEFGQPPNFFKKEAHKIGIEETIKKYKL
ncbi:response regulator [Aquimarina hainanensis]|uniref:histidine kinase n=1 Tax=Aquimarina hainanensis TaxID=1578017 RepID=A0ABW5ND51_9FLAO